jgi:hypothetical protein
MFVTYYQAFFKPCFAIQLLGWCYAHKASKWMRTRMPSSSSGIMPRRLDLRHHHDVASTMVTMITMGGDLQPGSLADRLLTGLGQPQINP